MSEYRLPPATVQRLQVAHLAAAQTADQFVALLQTAKECVGIAPDAPLERIDWQRGVLIVRDELLADIAEGVADNGALRPAEVPA